MSLASKYGRGRAAAELSRATIDAVLATPAPAEVAPLSAAEESELAGDEAASEVEISAADGSEVVDEAAARRAMFSNLGWGVTNPAPAAETVITGAYVDEKAAIVEVPAPPVAELAPAPAGFEFPYNAVTGARYQGKNIDRLAMAAELAGYGPGGWAGFGQWLKVGRVVRKGEHGTACITVIGGRKGESSEGDAPAEGKGKRSGGVRGFRVFHFDQTCELGGES